MDLDKLESMPGIGEEPEESPSAEDDLDPELAMLADEFGFDRAKASALKAFIELCRPSSYED